MRSFVLFALLASMWFAPAARAEVHLATYQGSYSYHGHSAGSTGEADYTDTLTWTMRAYWDEKTGDTRRELTAVGSHSYTNTNPQAQEGTFNCQLRASGRTEDLPINVGL